MKTGTITHSIKPIRFQITDLQLNTPFTTKKKAKEKFGLKIGHTIQVDPENRKYFMVDFFADIVNIEQTVQIHVKFRTLFLADKEITDSLLQSPFMQQSPPAIAFPYLRAFILTLSSNVGIDPIILPPVNFTKIKEVCLPSKPGVENNHILQK